MKILLLKFFTLTILFASFAINLHNHEDHDHDESCSVYVLEQYFIPLIVDLSTPIFPIEFVAFEYPEVLLPQGFKQQSHTSIRAPPHNT